MTASDIDIEQQLNDLAKRRRELTDQLSRATNFQERRELSDQVEALGKQARELEAEQRKQRAAVSPAAKPHKKPIGKPEESMPKPPTFELYRRMGRNSVAALPTPAVSLTTTQLTFNQPALDALGVKVGGQVLLYFARDAGILAVAKPKPGWEVSSALKIGEGKGAAAGSVTLGAFGKWAALDLKRAKGIYGLEHDEDHEHWAFQLPAGSWAKPASGTPGGAAGSATRGRGKTSAAKRDDLPATSPHRS